MGALTLYEDSMGCLRNEVTGYLVAGVVLPSHTRRILAAVNATSDLPIEALEADVVRKLVEALELSDAAWRGANMNMAHVEKTVRAALTLAKGEAA